MYWKRALWTSLVSVALIAALSGWQLFEVRRFLDAIGDDGTKGFFDWMGYTTSLWLFFALVTFPATFLLAWLFEHCLKARSMWKRVVFVAVVLFTLNAATMSAYYLNCAIWKCDPGWAPEMSSRWEQGAPLLAGVGALMLLWWRQRRKAA